MTSYTDRLRYEDTAAVTVTLSEAVRPLVPADFELRGLKLVGFAAESAVRYGLRVRSEVATGHATIRLPAVRLSDGKASGVVAPDASYTFSIDPRPPLAFDAAVVPLRYAPEDAYSYYSPGAETVNVFYSDSAPARVRTAGATFPSGFLVMVQLQKALINFDAQGGIRWILPSAGRFVTAHGDDIFVSDAIDLRLVHVVDASGQRQATLSFEREVNFVQAVGEKLVVVYNDVGPAEVFEWLDGRRLGRKLFSSVSLAYARAAALSGDRLALADTYGQRVVVQSLSTGGTLAERAVSYPNDLGWRGEFLYAAEEHVDRIVAFNLADGSEHVVLAAPLASRWDAAMSMDSLPQEFCGEGGAFPRSIVSDICSGEMTLYAPNGLYLAEHGLWVADTDNARVIYVSDDRSISVLTGLNGPVKIVPFH